MKILRYIPALNQVTGGLSGSILMMQLEYWFEKSSEEMFFKFLEPCEDPAYQLGDAWTEELGLSKAEFRHAFSKIGVAYKSKKLYREAQDKFQGKMYASYFDRIQRRTYYIRNTEQVEEAFRLVEMKESAECMEPTFSEERQVIVSENEKVDLPEEEDATSQGSIEESNVLECMKPTLLRVKHHDSHELGSTRCRSKESDVPISLDYYQENTYKDYRQKSTVRDKCVDGEMRRDE